MIETIFLLFGLVVDTFIMTSVDGLTLKENLKTYLGIETLFSIIGWIIGGIVLWYIPAHIFRIFCGILIIIIQIIDWHSIEFPERVNAILLGTDSLVVFATLDWIYIPFLAIIEAIAITLGSLVGSKVMNYVPKFFQDHASHIVMIIIGLTMILPGIPKLF